MEDLIDEKGWGKKGVKNNVNWITKAQNNLQSEKYRKNMSEIFSVFGGISRAKNAKQKSICFCGETETSEFFTKLRRSFFFEAQFFQVKEMNCGFYPNNNFLGELVKRKKRENEKNIRRG